jgi:uncharacterized membrane-anchored protein YjiN (DUF445 family)
MTYSIFKEIILNNKSNIKLNDISEDVLKEFEYKIKKDLPKNLRNFLKEFGSIKIKNHIIFEIFNKFKENNHLEKNIINKDYIFFYEKSNKKYYINLKYKDNKSVSIVFIDKLNKEIKDYKIFKDIYEALFDVFKKFFGENYTKTLYKIAYNKLKLKKMRKIATGLLVFMTITFLGFKNYEDKNLLFSSIVAFSEASMIGALADWFAVVALFRHPLGIKWIPHTAIIKNNKDRIGESLSSFVVNNFLNKDIIGDKLKNVNILREITKVMKYNSNEILNRANEIIPDLFEQVFSENNVLKLKHKILDNDFKLYPFVGELMEILVSSNHHIPIIKEILNYFYTYIKENREKTLRFIEGLNRTLSLPVIRNVVYNNLLKTLEKQIDNIEDNTSEISLLLNYSLPKLIYRLKTSEELIKKGEVFKKEVLESEMFDLIIKDLFKELKVVIKSFNIDNDTELKENVEGVFFSVIEKININEKVNKNINNFIKLSVIKFTDEYKKNIEELISETVKKWEADDLVNTIEVYVGADLQYIRINGTIIGGFVGLVINLITEISIF